MYEIPEVRLIVRPDEKTNWRGRPRWIWKVCEQRDGIDGIGWYTVMQNWCFIEGHTPTEEKALVKGREAASERIAFHEKKKEQQDRIDAHTRVESSR